MVCFSLIIPVYNEEKIIETTIKKTLKELKKLKIDYELIIADDGSTDNTISLVKNLMKNNKKIKLFQNPENMGRGETIALAIRKINTGIVGFMDADLSTNLKNLRQLVEGIKNGADISMGNRYMRNSKTEREFKRYILSKFFNTYISFLFGTKISDHLIGFKAFNRDRIIKILNSMGTRRDRRIGWDAELLIRAKRKGYRIFQFPVQFKERKNTKWKILKESFLTFFFFLKLRIKILFNDFDE